MSTVIITGASRGLGYALTHVLLNSNANVIAIARNCTSLDALLSTFPSTFRYVVGDVCDPNTMQVALQTALSQYGRLDSVIFNAGILEPVTRIADADVAEWKALFDINYFSIVAALPIVLPALRSSQGRIVMISSGAAQTPYQGWSAYGSSKAALNHLVQDLAAEERDVTTVSVKPGVVDTDMQRAIREEHGHNMDPEQLQRFTEKHRNGELNKPDVVAGAIGRIALEIEKEYNGSVMDWQDHDKRINGMMSEPLSQSQIEQMNALMGADMTGGMQPMVFSMQQPAPAPSRKRAKNSNADDGRHLFGCEVCGERFTRHENLKRHQRNHDETAIEHCPKCDVTCRRHDLLKRHVKKFHPNEFEILFPPKIPGHPPAKHDERMQTTDAAQTLTSLGGPLTDGIVPIDGLVEGQSLSAIHPHLQYDPSQSLHQYRSTDGITGT